jgi:hypothetical protein
VLLRESFSTAPSDSAFSHKEEKKEKKISPFFGCASKSQEDAFLIHQNSSEVLTCVFYIIHIFSSPVLIIIIITTLKTDDDVHEPAGTCDRVRRRRREQRRQRRRRF